jgi:hypothetical protein
MRIAIKFFRTLAADPQLRERFDREPKHPSKRALNERGQKAKYAYQQPELGAKLRAVNARTPRKTD